LKAFLPLVCLPLFLYAYDLKELVDISLKNRVVKAATLNVHAKEKAYDSTKSGYLPDVSVKGAYLNTYNETPAAARNTLRGTASLNYTLYDGGKKKTHFMINFFIMSMQVKKILKQ
jgi:outer membrane protein